MLLTTMCVVKVLPVYKLSILFVSKSCTHLFMCINDL